MKSAFMRYFLEDLAAPYGIAVRTVLSHSSASRRMSTAPMTRFIRR